MGQKLRHRGHEAPKDNQQPIGLSVSRFVLKKQAAPGDGAAWLAKSSGEEGELVYRDGPDGWFVADAGASFLAYWS